MGGLLLLLAVIGPAAVAGAAGRATDAGMPATSPEVLVLRAREGVAIGVWPSHPYQGALVVVDVAARGLGGASGKLRGANVRFHRLDENTLRGLVPVPDDAAPGKALLSLRLVLGKKKVRRTVPLVVEALAFDKDTLSVDPRFLKPPGEALARIRADRAAVDAVWKRGSSPEPHFKQGFVKPVENRTTAPYGTRRVYNGKTRSVHAGWDIDGEVGDPVLCDNDGVVALARDLYHSGGTMLIDHGAGLYSAYFHLSELVAKEGEAVKRGQLCAKVGESGRVTGPHLHWALKLDGHYLHPAALLLIPWERPMVGPPGETGSRPAVAKEAAP